MPGFDRRLWCAWIAVACAAAVGCASSHGGGGGSGEERDLAECDDGLDNDDDGLIDCADQDCWVHAMCQGGSDADVDSDADADSDADSDSDTDTDGDCVAPRVECADGCVDTTMDLANCGGCDLACDPTQATECVDGRCFCGNLDLACKGHLVATCCTDAPTGTGARCANLLRDERDCGECNAPCEPPVGDRCRNGRCTCGVGTPKKDAHACPEGQECCGAGTEAATCIPVGTCGD